MCKIKIPENYEDYPKIISCLLLPKFHKYIHIREVIERAKKNQYSKDTWMHRKVLDVATGIWYTYKELDELFNN